MRSNRVPVTDRRPVTIHWTGLLSIWQEQTVVLLNGKLSNWLLSEGAHSPQPSLYSYSDKDQKVCDVGTALRVYPLLAYACIHSLSYGVEWQVSQPPVLEKAPTGQNVDKGGLKLNWTLCMLYLTVFTLKLSVYYSAYTTILCKFILNYHCQDNGISRSRTINNIWN